MRKKEEKREREQASKTKTGKTNRRNLHRLWWHQSIDCMFIAF